jgi:hypothetical protein
MKFLTALCRWMCHNPFGNQALTFLSLQSALKVKLICGPFDLDPLITCFVIKAVLLALRRLCELVSWLPNQQPTSCSYFWNSCTALWSVSCHSTAAWAVTSNCLMYSQQSVGRDSAVSIATRSGDRIPVGARFSAPVQTDPGAHRACYTIGTGSLSRGYIGRDLELTTHPHLVPGLKRVQLYLYFPSGPSWPVLGRTLPLLYSQTTYPLPVTPPCNSTCSLA